MVDEIGKSKGTVLFDEEDATDPRLQARHFFGQVFVKVVMLAEPDAASIPLRLSSMSAYSVDPRGAWEHS